MDSTKLLISGFLDGELTDQEADSLAAGLQADSALLDRFVVSNFIHSQLLDWMTEPLARGDAVAAAMAGYSHSSEAIGETASDLLNTLGRSPFPSRSRPAQSNHTRHHLKSWTALAAAVLVAACIGTVAYMIESRPVLVGTLTDATGCQWGQSPDGIAVGAFLEDGQQLELLKGRAVITFATGAKLLLEAPASLRLESSNEVHLEKGRIAAKVPRQAIGFTVTSSLARFVDLGTAFTLNLDAEKSFQLHVFEGLVEVRLDKRFGERAKRPAVIAEVRAVEFNINVGDLATIEFEPGKQMPF
jgi:hypothetical protein